MLTTLADWFAQATSFGCTASEFWCQCFVWKAWIPFVCDMLDLDLRSQAGRSLAVQLVGPEQPGPGYLHPEHAGRKSSEIMAATALVTLADASP